MSMEHSSCFAFHRMTLLCHQAFLPVSLTSLLGWEKDISSHLQFTLYKAGNLVFLARHSNVTASASTATVPTKSAGNLLLVTDDELSFAHHISFIFLSCRFALYNRPNSNSLFMQLPSLALSTAMSYQQGYQHAQSDPSIWSKMQQHVSFLIHISTCHTTVHHSALASSGCLYQSSVCSL